MQTYRAREAIVLTRGIVQLSRDQAAARRRNLHPVGDNLYKIVGEIQFEKGEVFGYDTLLEGSSVEPVQE